MKLYEFGYRRKDIDALEEWLDEHPDVVLVDVRFGRIHPKNSWSDVRLRKRFGKRYLHVRALGNENYKRGGQTKLHNEEKGLDTLFELFDRDEVPVLMCACEDLHQCHRNDIIALVRDQAAERLIVKAVFEESRPSRRKTRTLFD